MALDAVLHIDPACPWAYSASPDLAVLRWRYGDGLRWRLVLIGLAEDPGRYVRAGYTPVGMAARHLEFRRRFGMPFGAAPRPRIAATGRACRAIVAARRVQPGLEWAALRALQFAWFCSDAVLDEDAAIAAALAGADGLDAEAVLAALADPATEREYQRDRAEARRAAGSPTEAQGKAAATDGPVRYTAPSVIFSSPDGRRLEAGGFQSIAAYDVCVANLDASLPRTPAPADPGPALAAVPHGLTTQEVAAILAPPLTDPDRAAAEAALLALVAAGGARRTPLGDDALWRGV
jgi:predicted DsbA family dithiol-disulfide isomerase